MAVVKRERKLRLMNRLRAIVPDDDPNGVKQLWIVCKDCRQTVDRLTLLRRAFVQHDHGDNLLAICVHSTTRDRARSSTTSAVSSQSKITLCNGYSLERCRNRAGLDCAQDAVDCGIAEYDRNPRGAVFQELPSLEYKA